MNQMSQSAVTPHYRLLNDEQLAEIHRLTLDLMEDTGVRVLHSGCLEMLSHAGCRVDENDMVHFPREMVEECMHAVPHGISIYDRCGQEAMRLEGRNNYFGLGTDLIYTRDTRMGEIRPSVLQDVANASRTADACQDIDFTASFALPGDVPTNSMYLRCFKAMVENTTKPIFFTAAGKEDLEFILQMAESVTGGDEALRQKPFIIHYSQPTAPLTHSFGAVNKVLACAEQNIPLCYPPTLILGVSAPVTLAGAIVHGNVMTLSGIVLHQLRRRGAPIIMGWAITPIDMRTTNFLYGTPEWRLTNTAFADLYHYYRIPMWSTAGSDANCLDSQAAMENSIGILMAALDGANLIHDIGYLGQGKLGSLESILMGDETISYVKRLLRGFEFNDETLAIDLIRQVGAEGNFLAELHTRRHHRSELWRARFANRDNMDTWISKGSKSYEAVLREKALAILEGHQPQPLSTGILQELEKISRRADDALAQIEFVA